ncbi:MAG TPA: histidine kinase N-terminal 7TM domain-containing protein [Patescibacteria group bacterium]|nr:histidine kinase N-terminal 7TM domain-containing protein [Patescibacteria group bacterium]
MIYGSLLIFFIIFLNFALGVIILIKNPKKHINISFSLLIFSVCLWIIINYFSNQPSNYATAFLLNKWIFVLSPYVTFFLLYFSFVFPNEIRKISFWSLLPLLVPIIVSNYLSLNNYVITGITFISGGTGVVFGRGIFFFALQFLAYLLVSFAFLAVHYFKSKGFQRVQIQYLLLGVVLTAIGAATTNFIIPFAFNNFAFDNYGPLFTVFIVVFTSYAVIRHRLWDIRLVLARSIAYTLLVVLVGSIYAFGIFLLSHYLFNSEVNNNQTSVYTGLALLIAFTFNPIRRGLENTTDKIFYRSKYNTDDLIASLTKIMAMTLTLEPLTQGTLHELATTLHIARGVFVITSVNNEQTSLIYEGFDNRPSFDPQVIKKLLTFHNMLILEELEEEEIHQMMSVANISIMVPLIKDDLTEGMLLLGEKKSGEIYTEQDINVLKIFGPEVSVAIQNAESYEKIKQFNVTLEQEVTRKTKQLKDLTEQQKDQVDIMGHEVRTPLTAISQQLNLLLEMILTEKKREEWLKGNVQPEDAKRVLDGLKKMQVAELQEESIVTNMIEAARIDKLRFPYSRN